jgi:hypothetical protein
MVDRFGIMMFLELFTVHVDKLIRLGDAGFIIDPSPPRTIKCALNTRPEYQSL